MTEAELDKIMKDAEFIADMHGCAVILSNLPKTSAAYEPHTERFFYQGTDINLKGMSNEEQLKIARMILKKRLEAQDEIKFSL